MNAMTLPVLTSLSPSWSQPLQQEFSQPYLQGLQAFLLQEKKNGAEIFPQQNHIFQAFNQTPLDQVKVVILGQDPYHGPGQAHGLSFSVPAGVRLPPSLRNIYKEIEAEYGRPMPKSGDLSGWARQGVLLLNATLTVRAGLAGSHQKKGWERFTDAVIHLLNDNHDHLVFMLWGSYGQQKGAFIDRTRHLVLEAPHPSPLSAHRGFLGCDHFKDANAYLDANGRPQIDWYDL